MNCIGVIPGVGASVVIRTPLKTAVDNGAISQYAHSASEIQLFSTLRVSTLTDPLAYPDPVGYNNGNLLICLYSVVFIMYFDFE